MKNFSNSLSIFAMLVYAIIMLGSVLMIILGIEEFATVIVPQLIEAINPF